MIAEVRGSLRIGYEQLPELELQIQVRTNEVIKDEDSGVLIGNDLDLVDITFLPMFCILG